MDLLFQIFGWLGAAGLLTAFFLNSRNILTVNHQAYHWLNFICALMLIANAYDINSYPFIVINAFWAVVALVSIIKPRRKIELK